MEVTLRDLQRASWPKIAEWLKQGELTVRVIPVGKEKPLKLTVSLTKLVSEVATRVAKFEPEKLKGDSQVWHGKTATVRQVRQLLSRPWLDKNVPIVLVVDGEGVAKVDLFNGRLPASQVESKPKPKAKPVRKAVRLVDGKVKEDSYDMQGRIDVRRKKPKLDVVPGVDLVDRLRGQDDWSTGAMKAVKIVEDDSQVED